MTYVPTDKEDNNRHIKHCLESNHLFSFPTQFKETIDYRTCPSHNNSQTQLSQKCNTNRTIIILKKHRLKSDFFDHICDELIKDGLNGSIDFALNEKSTAQCFLCLENRDVMGCLFVEQVRNMCLSYFKIYTYFYCIDYYFYL